jgi:hypothetical protein
VATNTEMEFNRRLHVTRELESIHEKHFVEKKNEDRTQDKNWSLRILKFMFRNLD